MVQSSRVGLWGEVGSTDLAASPPNTHLELGPSLSGAGRADRALQKHACDVPFLRPYLNPARSL
jgi:hypothetical protein